MASEDRWIDPKQLVGKSVTVCLKYPDDSQRFFNGIVNRFVYQGTHDRYSNYQAEVVPALWLLTRTADCKIFQEKDVPTIIAEVLHKSRSVRLPHGADPVLSAARVLRAVSRDRLQFRLATDGAVRHLLLLPARRRQAHPGPRRRQSAYEPSGPRTHLSPRLFCRAGQSNDRLAAPIRVPARKWCHSDYNFEAPRFDLKADIKTVVNLPNNKQYEIFDYPGEFVDRSDGEALVRVRMEEEEVPYDVVNGRASATVSCRREVPCTGPYLSGGEGPGIRGYRRDAHAGGADYTTGATPGPGLREQVHLHARQRALSAGADTPKPVVPGPQTAVMSARRARKFIPTSMAG